MGLLANWTMRQRVLLVLALVTCFIVTCFIVAIVYYYADKSAKAKAKVAKAKAAKAQVAADAAQATADAAADAQATADAARATADAVTGPCIPSNSCKEVGSRQPDGNCPSETNKDDGTLCGLAESLCRGGQCVADCDGSWSDWSACSVSCGVGGIKTKSYNVTTSPSSGGTPCPESVSQGCNAQPCLIQCTSPSVKTGYNVTSETLDDPSNFSVTVACDTDYHGTPSSTCGASGGPYVLSGCNANPTCQGYDCTGSANTINPNPDSIICAGSTCQDTECCTVAPPAPVVPSCTLPAQAPTGYVYGGNEAVTDTGPDTTDITCDATNGWYASDAASSIVASCGADTPLYSLDGCTQGCAKPVPGNVPPGYDLTFAPAFLAYRDGTVNIGGSCSVVGTGTVLGSCVDNPTDTIDYYTVEGCPPPVVSTPLPPTCTAPPQGQPGYIIADGNIGRPTGIVTDGVTCDASEGWYTLGVINANCGTPSSFYSLTGCVHDPEPVTQEPTCATVMMQDVQGERSGIIRGGIGGIVGSPTDPKSVEQCANICFEDSPLCKSFSYNRDQLSCYLYGSENMGTKPNTNYDYYPEKCQP